MKTEDYGNVTKIIYKNGRAEFRRGHIFLKGSDMKKQDIVAYYHHENSIVVNSVEIGLLVL